MQRISNLLVKLTAALLLLATPAIQAEDKKADPTGTWTWTMQGRDGQSRDVSLKLKKDGDKITGSVPGRDGGETAIENAKIEGDTLTFAVTREFNGNKFTQKYSGKIAGDTITGKIESERDGQTRSRDWVAKRKVEEKKEEKK